MRRGMDVSNYSSPFTQEQIDYIGANMDFVCIGLQDAKKARAFKAQLEPLGVDLMYYIERPGRDLTIPDAGSVVWVDIEEGCFVERNETLAALQSVKDHGLTPYVYGNRYSIEPVFGQSTELSGYPLVHAEYPRDGHVPDMTEFSPYNGWEKPAIWQYSSGGVAGINADLCVSYEEWPAAVVPVGIGVHFTDDTDYEVWADSDIANQGRIADGIGIRMSNGTVRTVWP